MLPSSLPGIRCVLIDNCPRQIYPEVRARRKRIIADIPRIGIVFQFPTCSHDQLSTWPQPSLSEQVSRPLPFLYAYPISSTYAYKLTQRKPGPRRTRRMAALSGRRRSAGQSILQRRFRAAHDQERSYSNTVSQVRTVALDSTTITALSNKIVC